MGPQPPPLHPRLPGSQRLREEAVGEHWRKFGPLSAGARATQATVSRGYPSQNASRGSPGSCPRLCPPGSPAPPARGGAQRVARSPSDPRAPARGTLGTERGKNPRPSPGGRERAGWRGCGCGHSLSEGLGTARPLRGPEEGGRNPLGLLREASPKPRIRVPWGNTPSSTWQGRRRL